MTYLTRSTSPYTTPGNLFKTIVGNANTVSFCENGTTKVMGSATGIISYSNDDGVTWNTSIVNNPSASAAVRTIIWDGSRFIAAASRVLVSTDGKFWEVYNSTGNIYGIAYSPSLGLYVAGNNTTTLQSSTDLINWTSRFTINGSSNYILVEWTGTSFIATATAAGLIFRSTDGISWSMVNEGREKYNITYDGSTYYAYGAASVARISTDGLEWTPTTYRGNNGATFTNCVYDATYKFVGVDGASSSIAFSTTGLDDGGLTSVSSFLSNAYYAIAKKASGNFVVVGTNDTKAFSVDKTTWTLSTTRVFPATSPTLNSLASRSSSMSNPKIYILGRTASASYSGVQYSTDGVTWSISNALTNYAWKVGSVPADVQFVAVTSGSNKAVISNDGKNWSPEYTLPSSSLWSAPVYISTVGRYILMISSSSATAYSTNGQTWTSASCSTSATWSEGAANSTRAVFLSGSTSTAVTTDGVTWSIGTITTICTNIAANESIFVALATGSSNISVVSTDGIAWTQYANMPATASWTDIAWNPVDSKFYAVASNYTNIARSTDGITWSTVGAATTGLSGASFITVADGDISIVGNSNQGWFAKSGTDAFLTTGAAPALRTVTYNSVTGKYSAYGDNRVAQESTDGITWSTSRLAYMPRLRYSKLINFNGTLLANHGMKYGQTVGTGSSNTPFSKNLGVDWGTSGSGVNIYSMAIASNSTCAIRMGAASNATYPAISTAASRTTDGINWSTYTTPTGLVWTGVCWSGTQFFAVGYGTNRAATTVAAKSTDGITWTAATMPASLAWNGVEYGNGVYVASWIQPSTGVYAARNTVYRSTDSVTWTTTTLPITSMWDGLKFVNGLFFLFDNGIAPPGQDYFQYRGKQYLYSTDGITWNTGNFPADRVVSDIAHNGSAYCVTIGSWHTLSNNDMYRSTDGITWTMVTLPHMARWSCITTVGSTFVALADDNYICINSTDGITWNTATYSLPTNVYKAITDSSGTNWLAGTSGEVTSTTDNVSFKRVSTDAYGTTLYSLAFMDDGVNLLVGGSDTSGVIYRLDTSNGRIWYPNPPGVGTSYVAQLMGYGNGLSFYQLSSGGYPIEWMWLKKDRWWTLIDTHAGYPVDATNNGYEQQLVYDSATAKYYIKKGAGAGYVPYSRLISSTDGFTWSVVGTSTQTSNFVLAYFNGKFVSAYDSGSSSSNVATSTDGNVWTNTSVSGSVMRHAQNNNVLLMLEFRTRTSLFRTTDAVTWTSVSVVNNNFNMNQSEIFWNSTTNKFHIFGDTSCASSTDGITWSYNNDVYPLKSSIVSMLPDNTFVLFSYANQNEILYKYTSTDGITWTAASTPCNMNITANIFHDGQGYYSLTTISNGYFSTDGITWIIMKPLTYKTQYIAKTGSVYTAVENGGSGGSGNMIYSTDGSYWDRTYIPFDTYSAIASNGTTLTTMGATNVATSVNDGVTWSSYVALNPPGFIGTLGYSQALNSYDNKFYNIPWTVQTSSYNAYYETTDNMKWITKRLYKTQNTMNIFQHTTMNGITLAISSLYSYGTIASVIQTSTDGLTWTGVKNTSRMNSAIAVGCSNNGSVFTIITADGYAINSTDGVNWGDWIRVPMAAAFGAMTKPAGTGGGLYPIATLIWDGSKYIAPIGESKLNGSVTTTYYSTSTDGVTWTLRNTMPGTYAWRGIAVSSSTNTKIAVANSQAYFGRSTDGITWTLVTPAAGNITQPIVAYGAGKFVVFETASTTRCYVSSDDGVTWSIVNTPAFNFNTYGTINWFGDRFIVSGTRNSSTSYNDILQSTDGLTWTKIYTYIGTGANVGTYIFKFGDTYVTTNGYELAYSKDLVDWYYNSNTTANFTFTHKSGSDYYIGASYNALYKNGTPEIYNYYSTYSEVTYG